MDRPRLIRGLRIAWSAVFGILWVLFIVLWVRSCWWADWCQYNFGGCIVEAASMGGVVQLAAHSAQPSDVPGWLQHSGYMSGKVFRNSFLVTLSRRFSVVNLPHWLIATLFASVATVPWMNWSRQYSLRTLLIATTLIAVLLGTVAYLRLW